MGQQRSPAFDGRRGTKLVAALATPMPTAAAPSSCDLSGLTWRAGPAWRRWLITLITLSIVTSPLATVLTSVARRSLATWLYAPAPPVRSISAYDTLVRDTPVRVTVGANGEATWWTTDTALRRDVTVWRRMRLNDWNAVPVPLRCQGLEAMLLMYAPVIADPGMWDRMRPDDWDRVPQPVRTVAFRRMVAYWCGFYGVGKDYGLSPQRVSDTVAAIVMSESWFEHRAVNRRPDGRQDIGLAQASPFARTRMLELYRVGIVDVEMQEADFLNPWSASRFAARWVALLLDESGGDLDVAVRAYHRGTRLASDIRGIAYGEVVAGRRERYMHNHGAPPAWDFVWRRGRGLFGPY